MEKSNDKKEMKNNKARTIKCQYCDSERIIAKPAQKTFVCCGHNQRIGELTLIQTQTSDDVRAEPSDDNKGVKKEVVEAEAEATLDTVDTGKGEEASTNPGPVALTEAPAEPPVEEKEEAGEDVEIEKEPEEEEINPDDYNYCCPSCKELFNDLNNGKCPECEEELE